MTLSTDPVVCFRDIFRYSRGRVDIQGLWFMLLNYSQGRLLLPQLPHQPFLGCIDKVCIYFYMKYSMSYPRSHYTIMGETLLPYNHFTVY